MTLNDDSTVDRLPSSFTPLYGSILNNSSFAINKIVFISIRLNVPSAVSITTTHTEINIITINDNLLLARSFSPLNFFCQDTGRAEMCYIKSADAHINIYLNNTLYGGFWNINGFYMLNTVA